MKTLRALHAALAYFTILPVGGSAAPDARALGWLPFVGALTGALAGGAAYGVATVAPRELAIAAAFAASIVLTGAIHLDGFLDGCDAFFASATPQRRLEILKDPRHGTFALAGLAIFAVVWLAAFATLRPASYPLALALAGAASRWSALLAMMRTPYRAQRPSRTALACGFVLIVALVGPLRMGGALAALVALAVALGACAWIRTRLDGALTGDAYGFAITLAEVGALVALVAR